MTDTTINWALRGKGERLAKTGLWLLVPPSLLMLIFIMCLLTFPTFMDLVLGENEEPEDGLSAFNLFMQVFMFGMLFQYAGLGMVLWALMASKCRARWFYYWMQVVTVLMLFASPGGIILAIVVSRYLHYKKVEFFEEKLAISPVPAAMINPPPFPPEQPIVQGLEEENARLKVIVAEQALDIQRLKSGSR